MYLLLDLQTQYQNPTRAFGIHLIPIISGVPYLLHEERTPQRLLNFDLSVRRLFEGGAYSERRLFKTAYLRITQSDVIMFCS